MAPPPPLPFPLLPPLPTPPLPPPPPPPPLNTPSEQHLDFLNADITCEEVCASLKRLKSDKATQLPHGVDGIKADSILNAPDPPLTYV